MHSLVWADIKINVEIQKNKYKLITKFVISIISGIGGLRDRDVIPYSLTNNHLIDNNYLPSNMSNAGGIQVPNFLGEKWNITSY